MGLSGVPPNLACKASTSFCHFSWSSLGISCGGCSRGGRKRSGAEILNTDPRFIPRFLPHTVHKIGTMVMYKSSKLTSRCKCKRAGQELGNKAIDHYEQGLRMASTCSYKHKCSAIPLSRHNSLHAVSSSVLLVHNTTPLPWSYNPYYPTVGPWYTVTWDPQTGNLLTHHYLSMTLWYHRHNITLPHTFRNSVPSGLRQGGGKSGSGASRHSLISWSSFPSSSSFWISSHPPIRWSLKKISGTLVLPGCMHVQERGTCLSVY